jgi:hypothetical protein
MWSRNCISFRNILVFGGSEMELLFYLELSAPEKDCSFVNIPDRSVSDIAKLLQTIKY